MSFDIASKIFRAHQGARFFKVDLHIHTPASKDYKDKSVIAEQIVAAAIDAELKLIAITDHNSVEFCEQLIRAASEEDLVVLPGFEITVTPGFHLLGIFPLPNDTSEINSHINDIREVLIKSEISSKDFGDPEKQTKEFQTENPEIIRMIENLGGIAIPAHIDLSPSGLCGRIGNGGATESFLDSCSIIEIERVIPEVVKSRLAQRDDCHAIVYNSDAHRLDEIGNNSMWLKMDEISISGLKQIALEPRGRISYRNPDNSNHPYILGFAADGGFLRDQVITFNSELNCLIGGRGEGKSAVIDYLRFVFDSTPTDDELKQRLLKRQHDIIQNGTTVSTLVYDGNDYILIRRKSDIQKVKRGSQEKYTYGECKLDTYTVNWEERKIVRIEKEFRPEIYSQGEVHSLTNTIQPDRQLKLVDDFAENSIRQRKEKIAELLSQITQSEAIIVNLETKISGIEAEISELPDLDQRIQEINAVLSNYDDEENASWRKADNEISRLWEYVDQQKETIQNLRIENIPSINEDDSLTEECDDNLKNIKGSIELAVNEVMEGWTELLIKFNESVSSIKTQKDSWDEKKKQRDDEWQALLRQNKVGNFALLGTERQEKEARINIIKNEKMPLLQDDKRQLSEQENHRKTLLEDVNTKRTEIREARKAAAKQISKKLTNVTIKLDEKNNINTYLEKLMQLTSSTNIRDKEVQLQKIVEKFDPLRLCEAIRNDDKNKLCSQSGVTENTAKILCNIDKSSLRELERVYLDDIISIFLTRHEEEKALDELSVGEQCSAILSIVLVTNNHKPLIIDQPEDELDHDFIMSDVISKFTEVKQKSDPLDKDYSPQKSRQFIVVTHNQNIPVLGDAEMVIKMRSQPSEELCKSESSYGLDHHETINHILSLEGGKEAFMRRQRRYDSLS